MPLFTKISYINQESFSCFHNEIGLEKAEYIANRYNPKSIFTSKFDRKQIINNFKSSIHNNLFTCNLLKENYYSIGSNLIICFDEVSNLKTYQQIKDNSNIYNSQIVFILPEN